MSTDLFNNISNDYIYPELPPCPGMGNDGTYTFEFLPNEQAGVVSGSSIISAIELGDIVQSITGWDQQTKYLQPGEVTYISGLTKGISQRKQFFPFDGSVVYTGENHRFYMSADISLNHYISFKHYDSNIFVTADADSGTDIANAFNIKFGELGIPIDVTYESEGLTFEAQNAGYLFDVERLDVSLWEPDTSIWSESLVEDASNSIPAFKYPNGAMLGYVLKVTYPNSTDDEEAYVKINHVPDYLEWFELVIDATDATCGGYYTRHYDAVDVGISKSCDFNTLSGGDYLNYVDTHNKWEKVGPMRMWISASDPDTSTSENLITGFYVFNPHDVTVKIEYMTMI